MSLKIIFDENPELNDLLTTDNINKFSKIYNKNPDDISSHFYIIGNRSCNLLKKIICYNTNKIAKFIITHEFCDISDLNYILNKIRLSKNKQPFINIFMTAALYLRKTTPTQMDNIFKKILQLKQWNLVDYLHSLNYRMENIRTIIFAPYEISKIWYQNIYPGKFDKLDLLMHDLNLYDLQKLNLTKSDLKKGRIELEMNYCNKPIEIIKYIENLGFKPTRDSLFLALLTYNMPIIIHILETTNIKLTLDNIRKMLLNEENLETPNFEYYVVKILDKYTDHLSKNSLNKILDYYILGLIYRKIYKFEIFQFIKNRFNLDFNLKNKDVEDLVCNLITQDNLENLKQFFDLQYFNPIDISEKSFYLDWAIHNNSQKIIKYFIEELHMKCSDQIYHFLSGGREMTNPKRYNILQNLNLMGFLNNRNKNKILNKIVKSGDVKSLKYLLNIKYIQKSDFKPIYFEKALTNNKIPMANYLYKYGQEINKILMIDKIICENIYFDFYYLDDLYKNIEFMVKIGCTASTKSVQQLIVSGQFRAIICLYEKCGLKPEKSDIYLHLTNYKPMFYFTKQTKLIEHLEYIKKNIIPNLYVEISSSYKGKILNTFAQIPEYFKYFVSNLSVNLKLSHLHYFIEYDKLDLNIIQYFENQGVKPDKKFFIEQILHNNFNNSKKLMDDVSKYLIDKYKNKFKFSISEFHEIINRRIINKNIIIIFHKIFGINFTPYTVNILSKNKRHLENGVVEYAMSIVPKITEETARRIFQLAKRDLKKITEEKQIIIYEPFDWEVLEYENDTDEDEDEEDLEHFIFI